MKRHHGANTLPVEVLSLIFDSLSIAELLAASHVSKYWRSVAHRHPTFWRDVTLATVLPAALDCFQARLEAGSTRSVTVRVTVPHLEFAPDERATVLNAIGRNLYRIDGLYIELDIAFDTEFLPVITLPAPRLRTIDLCLVDDTETSDILSADLFADQAPNLCSVRLINAQLRADRLPRVFSPITELYFFGDTLSFPTALFSHCTALETLVVYGAVCSLEVSEDEKSTLAAERLRHVDVSVLKGGSDLMQCLPCASIRDIFVSYNDKQSAQFLLEHLRGRLEIHLELGRDAEHLTLRYRAQDTGQQRTFFCAPEQVTFAYLPPVYVADYVLSRVETLHATAGCAGLLPAFSRLDACTRVALSLLAGARLERPKRPLCMPKLERVDISSAAPQSLAVGDLASFLDAAFAPDADRVQVALAGVNLDGDLAAIPQHRFIVSPDRKPALQVRQYHLFLSLLAR